MDAKNLVRVRIISTLSILLAVIPLTVSAQNLEVPQDEFSLSFSKYMLELSRGENEQLDVRILKSRGYRKSKTKMGISSILPNGVAITFDPETGSFDSTKANIFIDLDATPGRYSIILNATLNNRTKGTILTLLIK